MLYKDDVDSLKIYGSCKFHYQNYFKNTKWTWCIILCRCLQGKQNSANYNFPFFL